jgi:hypothetical protein
MTRSVMTQSAMTQSAMTQSAMTQSGREGGSRMMFPKAAILSDDSLTMPRTAMALSATTQPGPAMAQPADRGNKPFFSSEGGEKAQPACRVNAE